METKKTKGNSILRQENGHSQNEKRRLQRASFKQIQSKKSKNYAQTALPKNEGAAAPGGAACKETSSKKSS